MMKEFCRLQLETEIDLSRYKPAVYPGSFLVTPDNNILICDEMNHRLIKINLAGEIKQTIGQRGHNPGEFHYPKGIALDQEGNIYVADSFNHRIQKLSAEGQPITEFKGDDSWHLNEPSDINVTEDGSLVIVDSGNHRVVQISADGKLLAKFGYRSSLGEEKAFNLSQLTRPQLKERACLHEPHWEFPKALSKDKQGNFIVADPHNQRLVCTTAEGRLLNYIPLQPGCWPQAVTVDPEGYLWVSDSGEKHGLKLLTAEGVSIETWSDSDTFNKELNFPQGVVVNGEYLYLGDSFNQRILVLRKQIVAPPQAYKALLKQTSGPLLRQKYALYMEKSGQRQVAKTIYQELIKKHPDNLSGHYHYLNFLCSAKTLAKEDLAQELPAFIIKVLEASRKLNSELEKRYLKVNAISQKRANTIAVYEEETLQKGSAADMLIDRQEMLTRGFQKAKTALRETAVEISNQWQLLVKVIQRLESVTSLKDLIPIEPLIDYLDQVMEVSSKTCQRNFLDDLASWETKFTQKGSNVTWADVYLAKQQIGPRRALNAAREEICLAILDIIISLIRSADAAISLPQIDTIISNLGRLLIAYPEDPKRLTPLRSKFTLLVQLLDKQSEFAREITKNLTLLVKEFEYPPIVKKPKFASWLLINGLKIGDDLQLDLNNYYEFEAVKNQLVVLLKKWQARLVSNVSHQYDGRKKSAVLENTLKTVKKENKQEKITISQQLTLAKWALHISEVFYQQAFFITEQLFNLYLETEKISGNFFLRLSAGDKEQILTELSNLPEPDWEKTTEEHLQFLYKCQEQIVVELVKWEFAIEEEVGRLGYQRPGLRIYETCFLLSQKTIRSLISFNKLMLSQKTQLEQFYLLKMIKSNQAIDEQVVNRGIEELGKVNKNWADVQRRRSGSLIELASLLKGNKADKQVVLAMKKLDSLLEINKDEVKDVKHKWRVLLVDLKPLIKGGQINGHQALFDNNLREAMLLSETCLRDFHWLKIMLDAKACDRLVDLLLLDLIARQDEKVKIALASLLNDLKAAKRAKKNQSQALYKAKLSLLKFNAEQEQVIFKQIMNSEKLYAQLLGLLEVEFNPLFNQKRSKELAKQKKELAWRWQLETEKTWDVHKLSFFLWYRFFEGASAFLKDLPPNLHDEFQKEIESVKTNLAPIIGRIKTDFDEVKKRFMMLCNDHEVVNFASSKFNDTYKYLNMKNVNADNNPIFFYYCWLDKNLQMVSQKTSAKPRVSQYDQLQLIEPEKAALKPHKQHKLEPVLSFGGLGERPGKFMGATTITADQEGHIYVCDRISNRINKFSRKGEFILAFGEKGREPGQFANPWGVATDKNNKLYVSDYTNSRLQVFDDRGNLLKIIGQPGKAINELHFPTGIKVDKQGNLFVCEKNNHRIQVFGPDSQSLGVFWENELLSPFDLDLNSQGEIYVADYTAGKIISGKIDYQKEGLTIELLQVWDNIEDPISVALNDSSLFVAGAVSTPLVKFDIDTKEPLYNLFGLKNHYFSQILSVYINREEGKKYLYFIEKMSMIIYKFEID